MVNVPRWLVALAIFASSTGLATAQIGVISGPANSLLSCLATGSGTPDLRPEGYTELVGDIVISCTGGQVQQVGAAIQTANVVVYIEPGVPITSRMLGPSANGLASEALLIIDEAGSNITTGATGGYGPQAPQSLCTSAQEFANGGSACAAQVSLDASGQYQVAVVPGTLTPAQNVFQGSVGDFGPNSVTFYNVPVLQPAYEGVSHTFRITNIRIAVPGYLAPNGQVTALISTSPNQVMPVTYYSILSGIVGPSMNANVNVSPAGGGNPFPSCVPPTGPTLAAQVTFTEGFATGFKTRVVPGGASYAIPGQSTGNTTWAAEAQNLASPANQNIPGGLYGGLAAGSESGFILPAAAFTDTTSNITYTAGLADFGTRLKAVFSNIPAGVTVYVSTTSVGSNTIPGGTSIAPYAVLVAASPGNEANNDGAAFAPLTSAISGSDGLFAYPLAADNSGVTAAIWEVVNSNPSAEDVLTFSVYIAYSSTLGTYSPTNVAPSYAPEPGGGSFTTGDATTVLVSPSPRFAIVKQQGGPFATISSCGITTAFASSQMAFSYLIGGTAPASQTVAVSVIPSNLTVTATPAVFSPANGNWLSASISGGTLTISVNPSGLAASSTAYSGGVVLSATGLTSVFFPVALTVSSPPAQLSILKSHSGNFAAGELGATYTITVGNGPSAGPTSGLVTITEFPPSGMSVTSMTSTGNAWTCTTSACTTSNSISGGASYPPITVTVNVASNATSPLINQASVAGGGSSTSPSYSDSTTITPFTCVVTGSQTPGVADVQQFINQALGVSPLSFDLNSDGVINVADVQIVINAGSGRGCQ